MSAPFALVFFGVRLFVVLLDIEHWLFCCQAQLGPHLQSLQMTPLNRPNTRTDFDLKSIFQFFLHLCLCADHHG